MLKFCLTQRISQWLTYLQSAPRAENVPVELCLTLGNEEKIVQHPRSQSLTDVVSFTQRHSYCVAKTWAMTSHFLGGSVSSQRRHEKGTA